MTTIEGGCLCGAVRYRSGSRPLMTAVCHCTHCQKQTGSSFSMILAVPRDDFSVTGETRVFEDVGDSGKPVNRHFCPRCGSPIFSDVTALQDRLFIKTGTLDDSSSLTPEAHLYCQSAQSWIPLGEDVPQFPRSPRG